MKKFWKWKNRTVLNQETQEPIQGGDAVPKRHHRRGKLV